jgi:hypothetical protein
VVVSVYLDKAPTELGLQVLTALLRLMMVVQDLVVLVPPMVEEVMDLVFTKTLAVVAVVQSVSSGQVLHVHSHQQILQTYKIGNNNGTFY